MTTFNFSVHASPKDERWQENFSNDSSPPVLLDLEPYGISGWAAHSVYVYWADEEGIKRHTPDWCLHVAACAHPQLLKFFEACSSAIPSVDLTALISAASKLQGDRFVVRILEY